jgi:hypothetical protein
MKDNKKRIVLDEHVKEIMYRTNYKINESPRYRSLVDDNNVYDEIPSLTTEAGEPEDVENNAKPVEPADGQSAALDAPEPPTPSFDDNAQAEPEIPVGNNLPPQNPEQQVDNIQNEIIKHNIEAMKSIHSELESLSNVVNGLNDKMSKLNADVEEVREPSNSEKLMNKSNVSYPYYFNLNDFWKGNWFNEKRESESEGGIRKLPDGSYIADFDDLPQNSKIDIQNSFNKIT